MSKRKSADVNYLRVDDPKQIRLRAYSVSVFGAKKRCFNAAWYQRWDWLECTVKFDAAFCFLAAILNLKQEETFEECVVNQLLQPMAIVIGSMLLK